MSRWVSTILCVILIFSSAPALAQMDTPLGSAHLAVKVDYIGFSDNDLEDADADSDIYFGLEGYVNVAPSLYLGGEIGYADVDGTGFGALIPGKPDINFDFTPLEFNAKYVVDLGNNMSLGFGGGLSYSYVDANYILRVGNIVRLVSDDDWLIGAQIFADLNYRVDNFFIGGNLKFQGTEEFDDIDIDFSNFRIGVQAGFIF